MALGTSSPDDGANIEIPYTLEPDETNFWFIRESLGTWYDDDFTDAGFWLNFFANVSPGSITYNNVCWGYSRPNGGERIEWRKSTTGYPRWSMVETNVQAPSGPHDGTVENRINVSDVGGQMFFKWYQGPEGSEVLIQQGLSSQAYADGTLTLHYHNYNRSINSASEKFINFLSAYWRYYVTGYVRVAGRPAQRTVHAINRSTGQTEGVGLSDPVTGYYEISTITDEECYVCVLEDPASNRFQSKIRDHVFPNSEYVT
jgi:hypothetical protein